MNAPTQLPSDTQLLTQLLQERAENAAAVATCTCGMTHFVLAALGDVEQRAFLARAEQCDQRYRSVTGPVRICQVGVLRFVLGCPCGWDERLARLLWSERDLVVSFLTAKSATLLEIASKTTEQLDQLRRITPAAP